MIQPLSGNKRRHMLLVRQEIVMKWYGMSFHDINQWRSYSSLNELINAKGYLALYSGTSGFLHKADDVELSQGAEVIVLVQNVDKRRKKILFSMKGMDQVIKDKEESAEFLKSISVNDSLKGVVTGIKQFGVFVKVGPVEGLVDNLNYLGVDYHTQQILLILVMNLMLSPND